MNDTTDLLCGFRVIASAFLTKRCQYRFPRSKRRRIRAKWSKRECNYRTIPDTNMYLCSDRKEVVMHPMMLEKLKFELELRNPNVCTCG